VEETKSSAPGGPGDDLLGGETPLPLPVCSDIKVFNANCGQIKKAGCTRNTLKDVKENIGSCLIEEFLCW